MLKSLKQAFIAIGLTILGVVVLYLSLVISYLLVVVGAIIVLYLVQDVSNRSRSEDSSNNV
jgi:uncharacterized membrane protein